MNIKNVYIIVTNDADSDYAKMISHNIQAYLQKKLSESLCYTYNDICAYYSFVHDEKEKIAQFLIRFNCMVGFQNIFWLFFITSNSKDTAIVHWDQQIWVRAGKIIGQFSLSSKNWKNQISFWEAKKTVAIDSYRFILDGTHKILGTDYENIYEYVAGAERSSNQMSFMVLENKTKSFYKEIPIRPINKEEHALFHEFITISFSPRYQEIFLEQYNGHLESVAITRNERGEIILTANISEILIHNDEKEGARSL